MKKSPRQLLLERRATAEPELEELRQALVRGLARSGEPWWRVAWGELVLAARPAWGTLASLALVALGLHVMAPGDFQVPSNAPPPSPMTVEAAREQRVRLWTEVSDRPVEPAGVPAAPGAPRAALRRAAAPFA